MRIYSFLIVLFTTLAFVKCDDGVSEESNEPTVDSEPSLIDFDEKEFSKIRENSQKSVYQTEVSQMMKIIVNNLYKNKEVFLRELISNSFDALDKVRFYNYQNPSVLDVNPDLNISIKIDPINRILTVTDSGIGMSKDDLFNNLGTIAKSGTKDFIKKMSQNNQSMGQLSSQIGQFGVGFYSVFLVSDRVIVISKHPDEDKQHVFEADTNSFNIYEDPRGGSLIRGTSVIMYLSQEAGEFLEEKRIIHLIRKYSEFIQFPIYIFSKSNEEGKETQYHWKHVNNISPIWIRQPSNITEEEYHQFFNILAYGRKTERYAKPYGIIHFSAEGETNFRALLFIPNRLDENYVNNPLHWKPKLKLYVRRVMITEETRSFIPHYLSHLVGVIDSEDLPLNVGRGMLQDSEIVKVIRKKLVRKTLDFLKRLSEDNESEYNKFYHEFGNSLKFGIIDDESNSNRVARLLRFYSSNSTDKYTTLDEYITRMKPGQGGIYYITSPTIEDCFKSPYMERIRRKGYEILFMLDNIDEAIMQNLRVYDNKAIYNIAKEGGDVPKSKSEEQMLKAKEPQFKPLLSWLKKSYFKGTVGSIKLSSRLIKSSCILIASEQGYSGNMDRIVRSQAYVQGKESGVDDVLNQAKNIELNPFHPLVKSMLQFYLTNPDSDELKESADTCLSIATLSGGYSIRDTVKLSNLIEKLYLKSQNLSFESISDKIHEEMGIDEDELDLEDGTPLHGSDSNSENTQEQADSSSDTNDQTPIKEEL